MQKHKHNDKGHEEKQSLRHTGMNKIDRQTGINTDRLINGHSKKENRKKFSNVQKQT